MIPASKAEALDGLTRVWGDSPEARVGGAIIDLVAENLDSQYLPLSLFFEATNSTRSEEKNVVLNVVSFLAGAGFQLLKLQLEYIDDDVVVLLDDDAAKAASEKGINPLTGEADDQLRSKLYVCFAPSDVARRALKK
ncbi:hypothetical protein J6352_10875 [Burkholderia pseudomallei]|uniref:hypothetical protein n=1 Tax=Burkholderia TaxID=32008 RepID=UPI0012D94261|nr:MULTISPECIES: hypothetical protein [Burkholderia]MBO7773436.1 hypothetical protein [Burkholderia pseudomallei]MBO7905883.1 hypothetical protein [Burkholderia pseudomallei]